MYPSLSGSIAEASEMGKKKRRKKGSRHMGVYFAPGGRGGISSPKDLYPSTTFFDFRKSAE